VGVAGAAVIPCVQAARMRPLDVLQNLHAPRGAFRRTARRWASCCLLPAPVLALHLPIEPALRCKLLLYAALPALAIGCVMIARSWS
jgi:hypothetical protein